MKPLRYVIIDPVALRRTRTHARISGFPGTAFAGEFSDAEAYEAFAECVEADLLCVAVECVEELNTALGRLADQLSPLPQWVVIAERGRPDLRDRFLSYGASEVVVPTRFGESDEAERELLRKILSRVEEKRSLWTCFATAQPSASPPPQGIVAIAASTGGPEALHLVLSELGARFPLPVLVVQHMPSGFTDDFARSLDRRCELPVQLAAHGMALTSGRVLVAPGGQHLEVCGRGSEFRARLTNAPPIHGCRPAADRLFTSIAEVYRGPKLGVVLTGMGTDGCEGAARLRSAGARLIAQDEESAVVYGMPRALVDEGIAHEIAGLSTIAARIRSFAGRVEEGLEA